MDIPNNLLPSRLQTGTGFAHAEYFVQAAPGVTAAMVVDPGYWLHLASRLRINDRIEVVAADDSFDMDLRVVNVDPRGLYARVRVLRYCDGDGIAVPDAEPAVPDAPTPAGVPDRDGYVVEPGAKGWRVVRGRDLIADNLPTEAAAIEAREASRAGKPAKQRAA